MFDRVGAKERARAIMKNDLSACVGAYMFHILLCMVPFGAPAASVGLWRYNLDTVRGNRSRASKVLRGYDSFSRALALYWWNVLFLFLWALPSAVLSFIATLVGGAGIIGISRFGSYSAAGASAVISIILLIVSALWSVFISLYKNAQYTLSYAILADRPDLTAKQCLDASVEFSTPHVGNIIIVQLSFFGWLLLSAITSAVAGMLFVFPYMNLTWADLYLQVVPREYHGNAGADKLPPQPSAPALPNAGSSVSRSSGGSIRGVAGYYTGYKFQLNDGESISIGRDSKMAQIVFADSEDSKKISRLHCIVDFSEVRDSYTVTDRSSNGTFRADGSQLPPNTPVELRRGTTIYLGSPNNSFRLD